MEPAPSENMTIRDATRYFGIGRSTFYDLIRDGRVEAFKLGRRTLVRTESVRSFIDGLPRVRGAE